MVKISRSRAWRFPKTRFALFQCRIIRASGSGDLLSRSPMHAGARIEQATKAAQQRREASRAPASFVIARHMLGEASERVCGALLFSSHT